MSGTPALQIFQCLFDFINLLIEAFFEAVYAVAESFHFLVRCLGSLDFIDLFFDAFSHIFELECVLFDLGAQCAPCDSDKQEAAA